MLVEWFSSLGFQTRVDKKVPGGGGGAGWRGSIKIGLEKEKVRVFLPFVKKQTRRVYDSCGYCMV